MQSASLARGAPFRRTTSTFRHKSCEFLVRPDSPGGKEKPSQPRNDRKGVDGRLNQQEPAFVQRKKLMLHYAIVFFVVAIIAAIFGFGGIAAGAVEIAKILFFIFLVLFLVSLVAGLIRRN